MAAARAMLSRKAHHHHHDHGHNTGDGAAGKRLPSLSLAGIYRKMNNLDEDDLRERLQNEWSGVAIVTGLMGGLCFSPFVTPDETLTEHSMAVRVAYCVGWGGAIGCSFISVLCAMYFTVLANTMPRGHLRTTFLTRFEHVLGLPWLNLVFTVVFAMLGLVTTSYVRYYEVFPFLAAWGVGSYAGLLLIFLWMWRATHGRGLEPILEEADSSCDIEGGLPVAVAAPASTPGSTTATVVPNPLSGTSSLPSQQADSLATGRPPVV